MKPTSRPARTAALLVLLTIPQLAWSASESPSSKRIDAGAMGIYDPIDRKPTLEDARLRYSIPVSPAAVLIDVAGQQTIRHSGARIGSANLGFGPDADGVYQTSGAVAFHPYPIYRNFADEGEASAYEEWGNPKDSGWKEWIRRPAALSNVFVGLTKASGGSSLLTATAGVQLVLYEDTKVKFEANFPSSALQWPKDPTTKFGNAETEADEKVDGSVRSLPECLELAVAPSAKNGVMHRELQQMKRYRVSPGLVKAARQQQAEVIENRIEWCREQASDRHWNASSFLVGGAVTGLSRSGGGVDDGNVDYEGPALSVWATAAFQVSDRMQILLGARYTGNTPVYDNADEGTGFGLLDDLMVISAQARIDPFDLIDTVALLVIDAAYMRNDFDGLGIENTGRLSGGLEYQLYALSLRVMIGGLIGNRDQHGLPASQTFINSTLSVDF